MHYLKRELTEEGSCRDVVLVNAFRESDISLTNPINHDKNAINVNIFK